MEKQSVWLATAEMPQYDAAAGEIVAEVAVVGGGITGLTTALLAARAGLDVVVVEAGRLGSRTTGRTTGKVTSQHTVIYDELISRHGEDKARLYAEANQAAVDKVAELAVDCELERLPAYVYTNDEGSEATLMREAAAATGLGLPSSICDPAEVGLPAVAAMRFDDQVQIHPVKYLAGLASEAARLGVRIFEQSRVLDVDEKDDEVVLGTSAGAVHARRVVLATLLPIGYTGGYFARTRPSRSYGIAVQLSGRMPRGMTISLDTPTRSTRTWQDGLVVVGNGHGTGESYDTEENYQGLVDWVRSQWDVDVDDIRYRWSAQDYRPADRIPFVGRAPGTDAIFVATGFQKWGLSNGTAAAMLLTDLLRDRDNPWLDLYDARRIGDAQSVAKLVADNLKVGKDFAAGHLGRLVAGGADHLEVGQGGLLEVDGDTVGAYRDHDGTLHTVKPTCTHMGCSLTWNPAETSWDCPCHGSRFAPDGEVLDGPAVKSLERPDR